MKFSLIICTYMRSQPLWKLLESVAKQTLYPDEILIIDGSTDETTKNMLRKHPFENLKYFKVRDEDRGLTRQRNFGIEKVGAGIEIVCFLDDDTVLTETYFEVLLNTYKLYPEALGVGGYIINEVKWWENQVSKEQQRLLSEAEVRPNEFSYDGWTRSDGSRFVLRKKLGLDANRPPAHFPDFGHGRSVSFLPPSGKIYEVEQFMGGVASYKRKTLETEKFSEYFEGYGLYEDADFTLRLSNIGKLYVNTAAQLYHFHEVAGRPDYYKYGKMVVRNGYFVWRVKHPNPSLKARFKWNATSFLLTVIRFSNTITSSDKKAAFSEALGRSIGWFSLLFNKPTAR
ncbi:glycosyltransferase [Aequorivita sp. F47161]|uniref:Glycosyltransferase n=1 Tax=Aequorivita vitellina TaxID=2874475 RepID=A0A9X1QYW0_9FLAO|nr:glycosyltransferase family 2 protein [Aequorivita vitellina]MCG2419892.1 glycosyltransferase [Aequorivita vitellina]